MYQIRHINAAKVPLFFIETVVTAVAASLYDLILYSVQFDMLVVEQYLLISIIHRFLVIWKLC